MIRNRMFLLVLISALFAGAAAWFANEWITTQVAQKNTKETIETVNVVVAALNIPYGNIVERQHIKIQTMPKEIAPAGTISDLDEVKGKIAKRALIPGEIILPQHVTDQTQGSVLSALLSPKMRAVTLRVNDVVGVGGFLLPGNHVDILHVRRSGKGASTSTILKKVKILAVGQKSNTNSNDPIVVRSVTVEVSPKNAEKLVTAKATGSIQLTLRNPLEDAVAEVTPPKRVYRPSTSGNVTLIRGTKTEVKRVSTK